MKVVSFSIFKGGTGKTTTSVSTAAALVKKGKKVLLVDLDQQASATRYLDLDPDQSPSLYEVYMGTKQNQKQRRPRRAAYTSGHSCKNTLRPFGQQPKRALQCK